ncbi:MAG: hypothetical protein KGS72_21160 [Cyanobacteria bacterium REEB67]|nr:hypothetical protein [Cyanobacteria bacterium REEB67]
MASHSEIQHEATKITHQAELGTPKDLQAVHKELQNDMAKYSAQDYGKLLNGIERQNDKDVSANDHLPKLNLYDSGSGVRDSVDAQYKDGTVATANWQQQPTDNSAQSAAGGSAGGGADSGAWSSSGHFPGPNHGDAGSAGGSDSGAGAPSPPPSSGGDGGGSGSSGKSGGPAG